MKFKIIIVSILICYSYISPSIAYNNMKFIEDFKFAKYNFKWVKKDFYRYLDYKCYKKNIDPLFMLSLAQVESRGRNIISKKNKNGSFDTGFFQINSVHSDKPKELLNYKKNINKAVWYMNLCIKKAKGDKKLACVYYNAGLNCNVKKYLSSKKLRKYPKKILKIYNSMFAKI